RRSSWAAGVSFRARCQSTLCGFRWQETVVPDLDREVLDHRVDEEARAHLLEPSPRVVRASLVQVEIQHLAHPHLPHTVKPEPAEGALHCAALGVEDARLEPDQHARLHATPLTLASSP